MPLWDELYALFCRRETRRDDISLVETHTRLFMPDYDALAPFVAAYRKDQAAESAAIRATQRKHELFGTWRCVTFEPQTRIPGEDQEPIHGWFLHARRIDVIPKLSMDGPGCERDVAHPQRGCSIVTSRFSRVRGNDLRRIVPRAAAYPGALFSRMQAEKTAHMLKTLPRNLPLVIWTGCLRKPFGAGKDA